MTLTQIAQESGRLRLFLKVHLAMESVRIRLGATSKAQRSNGGFGRKQSCTDRFLR